MREYINVTEKTDFPVFSLSEIIESHTLLAKKVWSAVKPVKIFLHHPNLMFALSGSSANTGNLRESFFYNQVSWKYPVNYTRQGDFSGGNIHPQRWTNSFKHWAKELVWQNIKNLARALLVRSEFRNTQSDSCYLLAAGGLL